MSAKRRLAAASVLAIAGLAVAIPASAQQIIRPDAVIIRPRTEVVIPVQPVIPTPEEQIIAEPLPTATYQMPDAANPAWPHPPAMAQGPAPYSPSEYAMNTPISIAGRIVGVSPSTSSFKVQTPSEAWTVVVADGSGMGVRNGQTVTLTGYPHSVIRNQLLIEGLGAGSVAVRP